MKKTLCFAVLAMLAAALVYSGTITVTQPAADLLNNGLTQKMFWIK